MRVQGSDKRKAGLVALVLFPAFYWSVAPMSVLAVQEHTGHRPGESEDGIVITIVYDNYPFDERLETAWGFACVIEGLPETILFDTGGSGDLLLSNMAKLNYEPAEIDSIVLSHIHGDHTAGLGPFLNANGDVKVFLPPSFPPDFKHRVSRLASTVVETDGPCQVCEKAWTTGVMGVGIREQGLWIETSDGAVLITGCAHPGIVPMARAVKARAPSPIYTILGGFHMSGASADEILEVIAGLKALGVEKAGPCHCSGEPTRQLMKKHFGDGYMRVGVGSRFVFPSRAMEVK